MLYRRTRCIDLIIFVCSDKNVVSSIFISIVFVYITVCVRTDRERCVLCITCNCVLVSFRNCELVTVLVSFVAFACNCISYTNCNSSVIRCLIHNVTKIECVTVFNAYFVTVSSVVFSEFSIECKCLCVVACNSCLTNYCVFRNKTFCICSIHKYCTDCEIFRSYITVFLCILIIIEDKFNFSPSLYATTLVTSLSSTIVSLLDSTIARPAPSSNTASAATIATAP